MFDFLTSFIIQFIHTTGYLGIFLLMTLGSALIPVPSEITLPFAGFLTSQGVFFFPLVVLVASLGDVAGSLIGYGIGYFLEEELIVKVIKKHGKYVLLSEHDYTKASRWFAKYGNKIVFVAKLVPGFRYLISLPAGVLKMNLWRFSLYTFLGSLLWCTLMVYIGFYLGNKWESIGPYFSKFRVVIIFLLILLVVLYINHKLHLFPKKKTTE